MQKIYCRSIRDDGYGEGVVPEMEEPKKLKNGEAWIGSPSELRDWINHLASRPVLYLIHPDLAKVGFVGEHKEQYEVYDHWQMESWIKVSKETYDIAPDDNRRIVLVPVEGKEHIHVPLKNVEGHATVSKDASPEVIDALNRMTELAYNTVSATDGCCIRNSPTISAGNYCPKCGDKRKCTEQPADKAEEKEVGSTFEGWPEKYPDLQSVTEEEKDQIIEELTKTVTKNVLATFKALGLKTHMQASVYEEHFGEWFQFSFIKCANEQQANQYPKPTPVTGEDSPDYHRGFLDGIEHMRPGYESQAASRPSDAVDISEIQKVAKMALLWELIEEFQEARDIDEDIHAPKFSFNEIEAELYSKMDEVDPKRIKQTAKP